MREGDTDALRGSSTVEKVWKKGETPIMEAMAWGRRSFRCFSGVGEGGDDKATIGLTQSPTARGL